MGEPVTRLDFALVYVTKENKTLRWNRRSVQKMCERKHYKGRFDFSTVCFCETNKRISRFLFIESLWVRLT
jgi:hypothetical protein